MRIHEGKTIGTIILPIIVNTDNGTILWNARNFTNIYRVTNAMAAVDEMLGTLIGISRSSARPTREMRWFLSRHIRVVGLDDEAVREVDSLVEKVTLRILAGSNRRIGEDENERRLAAVTEFCESNQRTPGKADGEVYDSYLLFVHPHRPMDRFKKSALELKERYASKRAKATSRGHKMRGGLNNPKVVAQLDELKAYCREEGVRPIVNSPLGRFLDKRHSKRADPQLVKELTAIAERYPTESEKLFEDLYTRFFEFVEKYERLPRRSRPEEKQLADWASRVGLKPHLLGDRFEEFNRVYERVVTTTGRRHKLAG